MSQLTRGGPDLEGRGDGGMEDELVDDRLQQHGVARCVRSGSCASLRGKRDAHHDGRKMQAKREAGYREQPRGSKGSDGMRAQIVDSEET